MQPIGGDYIRHWVDTSQCHDLGSRRTPGCRSPGWVSVCIHRPVPPHLPLRQVPTGRRRLRCRRNVPVKHRFPADWPLYWSSNASMMYAASRAASSSARTESALYRTRIRSLSPAARSGTTTPTASRASRFLRMFTLCPPTPATMSDTSEPGCRASQTTIAILVGECINSYASSTSGGSAATGWTT